MRLLACSVLLLISVRAEQVAEESEAKPPAESPSDDEVKEFDKEGDVYVLHDKDFDAFVKMHPTFFAKFYAPWLVFL
ncbi:unnamed protein product [Strongylus vulgaris]|uniref:Uncharacterized protein n=1 Tax=Strongylus vulgaris TaxID=40348 RepID=A0A3P7IXH4_STRVU|nr:unnamed protein product [Strongylus vulgaris]